MTTIAATLSNHKILLIDDEIEHLELLSEVLYILHHAQVCAARNSQEALTCLETLQPTLILADVSLADEDDYSAVKLLRQQPATQHLPIFALAPYATRSEGQRLLAAGFDAYLPDPFDVPTLGVQLELLLDDYIASHQPYSDKAA